MKIKIGFSTSNSIISKLIRWFTKSEVSHAYIEVYDEFLQINLIIHADFQGIIIQLAKEFDIGNRRLEEYEIDDIRLDNTLKDNLWYLGKKYDYFKFINFAFFIIFKRWLIRKVKNPYIDPQKLVCVDFILYILNGAKIISLPIGYLTPKFFKDWCKENYENLNWKRKIYDNIAK
ncbi:hypothetical protein HYV49_05135 [Candidatus Pacearchaeota archaeon]|nr:hypothetical protein [Candidatus Pacearchaeota archaeon]